MVVYSTSKEVISPMRRLAILLLAGLLLLAAGCREKPDLSALPEPELLTDDAGEYILLDGVRYNTVPIEVVGSGNPGRWEFSGEAGERVAVLGKSTLFTVRGDEEKDFLWGVQEHWAPGPVDRFLFLREGKTLALPVSGEEFDRGTLRTYRLSGILGKPSVVTWETDDPEVLTALFDAWNTGEAVPPPESREDRESRVLALWSREYPWLAFRISCTRYGGDGPIYLSGREEERTAIPAETAAAITWEEPGLLERIFGTAKR